MSSTNHQPNPGKRPISEVTPEFPSLPTPSLEETIEFAKKSQEALVSVQQGLQIRATFSNNSYIFLPFISPHQLQQRFNVGENNSILVLGRKSYPALKIQLDSLNNKKYCGIYVQ